MVKVEGTRVLTSRESKESNTRLKVVPKETIPRHDMKCGSNLSVWGQSVDVKIK